MSEPFITGYELMNMKTPDHYPELWEDRDMTAPFVYFMLAHDVDQLSIGTHNAKFVKIGVAINPLQRENHLQTASPYSLSIWSCARGGYPLEKKLHAFLKDHRVAGEWFRASELVLNVMRDSPEDMPEISW